MNRKRIKLGNGCFWCIEAVFETLKGVRKVTSGCNGWPCQDQPIMKFVAEMSTTLK